jgi:DNA-binding NarL/FixJ family response regulator
MASNTVNGPDQPQQMRKARILIVEDHPIVQEGLAVVINREPDMVVCGFAASAREALQALTTPEPDLALVDVSLDGSHGIELVKDMVARELKVPVLMLSTHDEALYAERSLRAGARGYIMKREPYTKLLQAMRKVLRGEVAFSEAMTSSLLQGLSTGQTQLLPMQRLSDRELEVLEHIGRGHRTREIADTLHLSIKTVQTHREHIQKKLDIPDYISLTRFAVQWVESQQRPQ